MCKGKKMRQMGYKLFTIKTIIEMISVFFNIRDKVKIAEAI